jgi:hypothetical protein
MVVANSPFRRRSCFCLGRTTGSAAIGGDLAPGDVGGIFGSKEGHDFRDFFRASEPLERTLHSESFADLLHHFQRQAEFAGQGISARE